MESRIDGATYPEEEIQHEDSTTEVLDDPSEEEEVTDELIHKVYGHEGKAVCRGGTQHGTRLRSLFKCNTPHHVPANPRESQNN